MENESPIDFRTLRGHIRECSIDQYGSRYIQQKLDETKDDASQMTEIEMVMGKVSEEKLSSQPFKDLVYIEVLPHSHELINDVFGNYVVQKLIEFGSVQQKTTIVDQILGHMLKLTKSKYGCRVIQKAF